MEIPLHVTFRNMPRSAAIETNLREKVDKLGSLHERIMSCRVIVEAPHRHHHKGKAYAVRIDLIVPGGELVINRAPKRLAAAKPTSPELLEKDLAESHEPSRHAAHEDIYVAIRDAFNAAARKLQDYARKRRGKVKRHEPEPRAIVSKLFPDDGYGFLQTQDGREIYFHKNSVLESGFDRLELSSHVRFVEELGANGPQATTVRIVTKASAASAKTRSASIVSQKEP
jgi:cold shock CspA family protein